MVTEKFLIDSNIFITPYQNYYPFDLAPGFWKQLADKLSMDEVAILDVVKDEVLKGGDDLSDWFYNIQNIHIISRKKPKILQEYAKVLNYLQCNPLYTDRALRAWATEGIADPWLIAAAKAYDYTIITLEATAGPITTPSRKPKIPNICLELGVACKDLFYFMRQTGFKL